jgi:Fuc2NAc and GlcNAc transferase
MMLAGLCFVAFALSTILTGLYRRYAIRRRVVDVPTARSSHTIPTPRGGGIAIVVSFLAILVVARGVLSVPSQTLAAIAGAGASMALVGFLDDHGHVPAGWRLLTHFAGAAWALGWLGDAWIPELFGLAAWSVRLGYGVAALGIVWLLNLYNFMDGIDGIASLEAITVCVPAAILGFLVAPSGAWSIPLLLAACTAGFLVWNFPPPARIFMGDAGSNFLGVTLAILAMAAAATDVRLLWAWGILLGTFIVDATVTLLRRLQRRKRVHEAHRTHAYQHASRKYGGHRPVSLATAAINVLWLSPIAAAVTFGKLPGAAGILVAFVPLVFVAIHYDAGVDEARFVEPRAELSGDTDARPLPHRELPP